MKNLVLPIVMIFTPTVAAAEAPAYLVSYAGTNTTVPQDAESLVDLASSTAIQYLQDGNLSDSEAKDLLGFMDIERVARFTLGARGRSLTDAEFKAFRTAFEDYATGQFKTHLEGFSNANLRVVDSVARKPDDVVVKTELIMPDGEVQNVNWRVIQRDGNWAVVDVEAFGFWFAIEQREQFAATLDKNSGDIKALLRAMKSQKG